MSAGDKIADAAAANPDGEVLTHPSTAVPGEVHLGPADECRTCKPLPRATGRTVAQAHADDLRAELGKVESRVHTITEVQRIAGDQLNPAAVGLALEYVKVLALVEIHDRLVELTEAADDHVYGAQ